MATGGHYCALASLCKSFKYLSLVASAGIFFRGLRRWSEIRTPVLFLIRLGGAASTTEWKAILDSQIGKMLGSRQVEGTIAASLAALKV